MNFSSNLLPHQDKDGVDDARYVPEDSEQQAYPKLHPAAVSEKDSKRRQDNGKQNINERGRTHYTASSPSSFFFFFLSCLTKISLHCKAFAARHCEASEL
eukprot:c11885_g1_i1 orf=3-299(-)